MFFLSSVALFYLSWLAPGYLSPWLLVVLLPPCFFCKGSRNRLIRMLVSVLLLLSFIHSSGCSEVKASIPKDGVTSITVRVIADSRTKKKRRSGFEGEILYVSDRFGTHASGGGRIYILSDSADLHRGDRVKVEGNFQEGSGVFFSTGMRVLEHAGAHRARTCISSFLRERLSSLPESVKELSLLLLLGEGDDPTFILTDRARMKGVSHVFALSGMHLSLLCSFLLPVFSLILGKKRAKKAVLVPLLFFTYTSSWRPSLLRAFIFRAVRTFIRSDDDTAFALTVIIHGFLFPYTLLSVGSMFSYLSLAALFWLTPRLDDALKDIIGFRPTLFTASLSCLIATAPYALSLFGEWSLSSLVFSPPVSLLVTLFMGLVLLVLPFPFLGFLLDPVYRLLERLLMTGWGGYPQTDLVIWFWMSVLSLLLLGARKLSKRE